jgi:hypothetical protein
MAMLLLAGALACAAELKGYISDAACGWNNARSTKEARECAQKCVKAGWDPVFVLDGDMNTHKVSDKAKVMPFVGERVTVTGKIEGGKVTVERVRKLDDKPGAAR